VAGQTEVARMRLALRWGVGRRKNRCRLIKLAGMNTRAIIIPIATGLLGFCLGTLTGPIDLRSRGSLERENAALREERRLLNQLVETYKREQAEVRAVLEGK
jgi:hypothetical protein